MREYLHRRTVRMESIKAIYTIPLLPLIIQIACQIGEIGAGETVWFTDPPIAADARPKTAHYLPFPPTVDDY